MYDGLLLTSAYVSSVASDGPTPTSSYECSEMFDALGV